MAVGKKHEGATKAVPILPDAIEAAPKREDLVQVPAKTAKTAEIAALSVLAGIMVIATAVAVYCFISSRRRQHALQKLAESLDTKRDSDNNSNRNNTNNNRGTTSTRPGRCLCCACCRPDVALEEIWLAKQAQKNAKKRSIEDSLSLLEEGVRHKDNFDRFMKKPRPSNATTNNASKSIGSSQHQYHRHRRSRSHRSKYRNDEPRKRDTSRGDFLSPSCSPGSDFDARVLASTCTANSTGGHMLKGDKVRGESECDYSSKLSLGFSGNNQSHNYANKSRVGYLGSEKSRGYGHYYNFNQRPLYRPNNRNLSAQRADPTMQDPRSCSSAPVPKLPSGVQDPRLRASRKYPRDSATLNAKTKEPTHYENDAKYFRSRTPSRQIRGNQQKSVMRPQKHAFNPPPPPPVVYEKSIRPSELRKCTDERQKYSTQPTGYVPPADYPPPVCSQHSQQRHCSNKSKSDFTLYPPYLPPSTSPYHEGYNNNETQLSGIRAMDERNSQQATTICVQPSHRQQMYPQSQQVTESYLQPSTQQQRYSKRYAHYQDINYDPSAVDSYGRLNVSQNYNCEDSGVCSFPSNSHSSTNPSNSNSNTMPSDAKSKDNPGNSTTCSSPNVKPSNCIPTSSNVPLNSNPLGNPFVDQTRLSGEVSASRSAPVCSTKGSSSAVTETEAKARTLPRVTDRFFNAYHSLTNSMSKKQSSQYRVVPNDSLESDTEECTSPHNQSSRGDSSGSESSVGKKKTGFARRIPWLRAFSRKTPKGRKTKPQQKLLTFERKPLLGGFSSESDDIHNIALRDRAPGDAEGMTSEGPSSSDVELKYNGGGLDKTWTPVTKKMDLASSDETSLSHMSLDKSHSSKPSGLGRLGRREKGYKMLDTQFWCEEQNFLVHESADKRVAALDPEASFSSVGAPASTSTPAKNKIKPDFNDLPHGKAGDSRFQVQPLNSVKPGEYDLTHTQNGDTKSQAQCVHVTVHPELNTDGKKHLPVTNTSTNQVEVANDGKHRVAVPNELVFNHGPERLGKTLDRLGDKAVPKTFDGYSDDANETQNLIDFDDTVTDEESDSFGPFLGTLPNTTRPTIPGPTERTDNRENSNQKSEVWCRFPIETTLDEPGGCTQIQDNAEYDKQKTKKWFRNPTQVIVDKLDFHTERKDSENPETSNQKTWCMNPIQMTLVKLGAYTQLRNHKQTPKTRFGTEDNEKDSSSSTDKSLAFTKQADNPTHLTSTKPKSASSSSGTGDATTDDISSTKNFSGKKNIPKKIAPDTDERLIDQKAAKPRSIHDYLFGTPRKDKSKEDDAVIVGLAAREATVQKTRKKKVPNPVRRALFKKDYACLSQDESGSSNSMDSCEKNISTQEMRMKTRIDCTELSPSVI